MHHNSYNGNKRLTTGGTVRKATALSDPNKVHQTTLQNLNNLLGLVEFNIEHKIKCLRTSLVFPWYDLVPPEKSDFWKEITELAEFVGNTAKKGGVRITAHPSHFVCLASERDEVVRNSISELEAHGVMFDILGFPQDHNSKINIHIGGSYGGNYPEVAKKFCRSFNKLSNSVKKRLTVENDDRESGWGVAELKSLVHEEIGTPIVFDSLHWECGPKTKGNESYSEALERALETWEEGIVPIVHHSQSATLERNSVRYTAHSDSYTLPFNNTSNRSVDIMLESKHKEVSCLHYIQNLMEKK
jgi:UV DNA damage endonuclease